MQEQNWFHKTFSVRPVFGVLALIVVLIVGFMLYTEYTRIHSPTHTISR